MRERKKTVHGIEKEYIPWLAAVGLFGVVAVLSKPAVVEVDGVIVVVTEQHQLTVDGSGGHASLLIQSH